MKKLTAISLAVFLAALPLCSTTPADAGNSSVEAALQSYGDLSMFYQGLLNSGAINELNEGSHYTIFAPVNASFTDIRPQVYPCFYAIQCRPQIARLFHDHIVFGNHDEADLVTYGQGIQTAGGRIIHVEEPFVGDYTVDGHKILSMSQAGGNTIYRIDGVITDPEELAQFQTVAYVPSGSVTTVTRRIYHPAAPTVVYPSGTMVAPEDVPDDNATETTTVIHRYTTEPY